MKKRKKEDEKKKEGGKRKKEGRERGGGEEREGRKRERAGSREKEDTCTSCHHFYITNSLSETDLQNFINHNNFEMCSAVQLRPIVFCGYHGV